jgi:hypothetical protein
MNGDPAARLGKLGSTLATIILVLALSLAISWPLWRLATGDRRAYTAIVGVLAALAILSLAGLAIARRVRARAAERRSAARRLSA